MLKIARKKPRHKADSANVLIVGMNHKMTKEEMASYDLVIVASEDCGHLKVEIANFKSTDVVHNIKD